MRKSAFSQVLVLLTASVYTTSALKMSFVERAPRGVWMRSPFRSTRYSFNQAEKTGSDSEVRNINDFRYVTNITINGVEVQVALDTGSTDLWINPPGGIGAFNDTGIKIQLLYGDGSYGTSGTIGVSLFTLGSYNIEKQAFLNAQTSNAGGLSEVGIYGLMGLSFDFSSASPINKKVKSIYGEDTTWGRSVLRNIFAQNPTQPNFIGINLARTGDLEDTTGGSFTISEYDDKFVEVANKTKLSQYPKGGDRWTTLLEGIFVNGNAVEIVSAIPGVPPGHAQALFDTGDPSSVLPVALLDGIYSRIPGAALYDDPTSQTRLWVVPCNSTAHVEFMFGSEMYSIHPLDISIISEPLIINGQLYTACVSSMRGVDNWGGDDFDISLGDTFLRNVYSVFDFGDPLSDGFEGEPYLQLFGKTDPTRANAQVSSIRRQTMASLPPEMDPATLVGTLLGSSLERDNNHLSNITSTGDANSGPNSSGSPSNDSPKNLLSNGGFSDSSSDSANLLRMYGPIIVGLLIGNMVLTTGVIFVAVISCIRRGSPRKRTARRVIDPDYMPVKVNTEHQSET